MWQIFILLFSFFANATEVPKKSEELPYLGPGMDLMSKEEYRQVYRDYIQQTILLGFPVAQGANAPCEQALTTLFRQAGFMSYPVPTAAQQIQKWQKSLQGKWVEFYWGSGVGIQVIKSLNSKNLERAIYLNTNSPKAAQKITEIAKNQLLVLERDSRTGLEKVKSLPVGYPHPFLDPEGQGILVKEFLFNGKKEECALIDYVDNSWVGGFTLSAERCEETQKDVDANWSGKLSPEELANKERERIRKSAILSAKKRGIPEAAAKDLVEKGFRSEFGSDVSMVGNVMRNLAQCNQYAMGGIPKSKQENPVDSKQGQESSGAQ